MNKNDFHNAIEGIIEKLQKEGGPLHGLVTNQNKNNIINAIKNDFTKEGIDKFDPASLKDPKILTLICATAVKAAVAEKFFPELNLTKNNPTALFNSLTPAQQAQFKNEFKDRMQKLDNPTPGKKQQRSNPDGGNRAMDEVFEVLLVDSSGRILTDTGVMGTLANAFVKLENIQQRDPDESKFSLYIQHLLEGAVNSYIPRDNSLGKTPTLNPFQSKL